MRALKILTAIFTWGASAVWLAALIYAMATRSLQLWPAMVAGFILLCIGAVGEILVRRLEKRNESPP